ncbi:MAG: penicillin-binding protein 2 [Verrucomicrobia bacterium]|jgi:cell division protein FtsI/penicillin-binding protein 2|nr:penicillin-binding protein 2 [Verrucomicrobiota bacterium]
MTLPHARRPRFRSLAWVVSACFLVVVGRLVWLHWIDAPSLRAEALQRRYVFQEKACRRGEIRDAQDNLLAVSEDVWDIGVDPEALQKDDQNRAAEVAAILRLPLLTVKAAFNPSPRVDDEGVERRVRWVVLARECDEPTMKKIQALKVKALRADLKYRRNYPKGQLAAHVVGYVNKEMVPSVGIEKALDGFLQGQKGWIESERDGHRREIASNRLREVAPVDGSTVVLTINSLVQNACEVALEKAANQYTPKSGIIIVSEPRTGRILGLANWPTFDLNKFFDPKLAPMDSQRNRAVSDIYEPGSVFKIVSISGALEEHLITPNSVYDCGLSSVPYKGRMVSLPADSHPLGAVDVRHIVRESSNRGTVQIGMLYAERLGEERFDKLIRSFGFGSNTGLLTGAESGGMLIPPSRWDGLTVSRVPMGHSVSVTAMQMHYAMSVVAADGLLMQPQLVLRIEDPKTKQVVLTYPPRSKGRAITSSTATSMATLLRAVCGKGGTAPIADIADYEVAGKTGTTQKIINGKYSSSHHVASFSGFFPVNDPKLAITVIIDEPHGEGVSYGGKVSAPIFREVALECIKWLNIPKANAGVVASSSGNPNPAASPATLVGQ